MYTVYVVFMNIYIYLYTLYTFLNMVMYSAFNSMHFISYVFFL